MTEAKFLDLYFRGELIQPDRMMNLPALERVGFSASVYGKSALERRRGQRLVRMCVERLEEVK